ncbi:MAG: hypothetical protein OEZ01_02915 [Candidatus Heimdallarchaeota archaeon]|nr:hypothetical protein [Candidatus Heimdallarchaeota archaeon]MDH5644929.1 hypothetical protein [Candidatus Heimdallarchaeota archaeon]
MKQLYFTQYDGTTIWTKLIIASIVLIIINSLLGSSIAIVSGMLFGLYIIQDSISNHINRRQIKVKSLLDPRQAINYLEGPFLLRINKSRIDLYIEE